MNKLLREDKLSVVADLGLTCCGDVGLSLELIDVASELGVDAVKFQMLDADELLGDKAVEYTYPTLMKGNVTENMYEMFLGLEMSDHEWHRIRCKCEEVGLELIITSHVESAVDRLLSLDLPYNKICTWSVNHFHMISRLASNGKPLIIDTGTISNDDLIELEGFYKTEGGGNVIVFYDFHTADETHMNFRAIESIKNQGFVVGYTPQGRQDWLDFMSIGLGVSILEKRLTMSRFRAMNGHWKAHDPQEFKDWLERVNKCFLALGSSELKPTPDDIDTANWAYKSAYLARDVNAGEIIDRDSFIFKRPGTGVSSKTIWNRFHGAKFQSDYRAGDLFSLPRVES